MCNGWNHSDGCDCGFGPPYDRDIPRYFDQQVSGEAGRDLSAVGRYSASLGTDVQDSQLTTRVVSTLLLQSYAGLRDSNLLAATPQQRASRPVDMYVVRHGQGYPHTGYPRHDLLIFDSRLPRGKVEKGYIEASPADLRAGWQRFRKVFAIEASSRPKWLSGLSLDAVPEIAREAMDAQRHYYIAMHPPHVVWTSVATPVLHGIASPALAIENRHGKSYATVGVVATDQKGRVGVTTALHALKQNGSKAFVSGSPGIVRARDPITDSCFVEIDPSHIPPCSSCNGPLTGVTPGRGEVVWFDGVTSGKCTTYVDAWSVELPWVTEGIQARILTPPVTMPGDSGAALMNNNGQVIGFAFNRTGFNAKSAYSAWMWAESVYSALGLQ